MLEPKILEQIATRYQTTMSTVVREYCQHLFLSALYRHKEASLILFKGGTALRIIYGSPRFSEDLDFSSSLSVSDIENVFEKNLIEIQRSGIEVDIKEAKKTSGGYLAIVIFNILSFSSEIFIEVSGRNKKELSSHVSLIQSDFVPPYSVIHLATEKLIKEKTEAVLTRSKPRDFFDIYFLLRSHLFPTHMKKKLNLILNKLQAKDIHFSKELKLFLPVSQHIIIRDFKNTLKRELLRYSGL